MNGTRVLLFVHTSAWKCSTNETNNSSKCPSEQDQPTAISRRTFSRLLSLTTITSGICCSLRDIKASTTMGCGGCCQKSIFRSKLQDIIENNFATLMETGMDDFEKEIASYKQELFSMIQQPSSSPTRIVDIGLGTGPNLSYYNDQNHDMVIVGIEPNHYMWDFAKKRAQQYKNLSLDIIDETSENLSLPNDSADFIVTTLTLCSVKNVTQTLNEVKRVLRPGGLFFFIEHVLAEDNRKVLRAMQQTLTPLQRLIADNCHLNRKTDEIIMQSFNDETLYDVDIKHFDVNIGSKLERALSPLRTHISGYVRSKV